MTGLCDAVRSLLQHHQHVVLFPRRQFQPAVGTEVSLGDHSRVVGDFFVVNARPAALCR